MASLTALTKGSALCEGFDCGGVVLFVPGPGREAGVADAVKHAVDAADRVLDAELGLQDPHHVPAAQRADAVFGKRPGIEAGLEPLDLLGGELGGCAARLAWNQCLQSATPVATDPLVDEPW